MGSTLIPLQQNRRKNPQNLKKGGIFRMQVVRTMSQKKYIWQPVKHRSACWCASTKQTTVSVIIQHNAAVSQDRRGRRSSDDNHLTKEVPRSFHTLSGWSCSSSSSPASPFCWCIYTRTRVLLLEHYLHNFLRAVLLQHKLHYHLSIFSSLRMSLSFCGRCGADLGGFPTVLSFEESV